MKIERIKEEFRYNEVKRETYSAVGQKEIRQAHRRILTAMAEIEDEHKKALSKPFSKEGQAQRKVRAELLMYVKGEYQTLKKAVVKKIG